MKFLQLSIRYGLLLLFLAACNHPTKTKTMADDVQLQSIQKMPAENAIAENNKQESPQDKKDERKPSPSHQAGPKDKAAKPDWDRKIIKTASINLEVKDNSVYNEILRDNVKQFGGYIAQEQQEQSDYKIETTVTLKIPVDQFDEAVGSLTNNTGKLLEKKISSDDVTTEFVDTKSRMESKRQVRLRYLDLLKQAKNMDEILQVQREIDDIQEQIESAAGRIEYLGHAAVFSTINLVFYQVLDAKANDNVEPGYLHKITMAFTDGLKWIGSMILGLVALWPLGIGVFIGWIIYRKWRTPKIKSA